MAYTTEEKIARVKAILETDLTDAEITGFIEGATALMAVAFSGDTTLGEALRAEIERWLTAHFMACTRVQQIKEAKAGPTSVKYQGYTSYGLNATHYGQSVRLLDTTGKLYALSGKRASIYAVPEGSE
jgi:hypothetical protein